MTQGTAPRLAGFPNPVHQWDETIAHHMARGMSKTDAVRKTVKEDPGLHARYLYVMNVAHQTRQARNRR